MTASDPWRLFREPSRAASGLRERHRRTNLTSILIEPIDGDKLRQAPPPETWTQDELRRMVPLLRRTAASSDHGDLAADILCQIDGILTDRIGNLKDRLEQEAGRPESRDLLRAMAAILELWAEIGGFPRITGNFYRREALAYSSQLELEFGLQSEDLQLRWQIFSSIGLHDQAQTILDDPAHRRLLSKSDLVFLEAKGRFLRGHYMDAAGLLQDLPVEQELTPRQRLKQFWTGGRNLEHID